MGVDELTERTRAPRAANDTHDRSQSHREPRDRSKIGRQLNAARVEIKASAGMMECNIDAQLCKLALEPSSKVVAPDHELVATDFERAAQTSSAIPFLENHRAKPRMLEPEPSDESRDAAADNDR